jgi:hypothetical protein
MRRGREKRRVSVETARGEKEKKLVYKSQQGGGDEPWKKDSWTEEGKTP